MLQSWSVVLREGQRLRVFNICVLTKWGPNIHEVMGRLVKLHSLFVENLMFSFSSNDEIATMKGAVKKS
jgi:hypothetical protein